MEDIANSATEMDQMSDKTAVVRHPICKSKLELTAIVNVI